MNATGAPLTDTDVAALPFMQRPLTKLLGTRTATPLAKMGLETAGDLLRHYPRKYAEPGTLTNIAELQPGEHVTVVARIHSATVRHMRSRSGAMLHAQVSDGTHTLSLTFFAKRSGVLRLHEDKLRPGRVGLFTGTVSDYRGERQLTHPDYVIVGVDADDEDAAVEVASRPIPIYPATAAVPTWRIERCVATVLGQMRPTDVVDPLPETVRQSRTLDTLFDAFHKIHQPHRDTHWRNARRRFRFEEAFIVQSALLRRKAHTHELAATPRPLPRGDDSLLAQFDTQLPFTLTAGQVSVGEEISTDIAQEHPMQRLLQGDVGSGKTIVALRAMLQVIDGGGQAALLAPTEVLAAQHARSIEHMLGDLALGGMLGGAPNATKVVLLTGSLSTAEKRQAMLDAASGAAGIIIGTHALLSDSVQFADLSLVVVDEQHRFGVEQRDALKAKGRTVPHMLVMTATPIPRTVAMTVFGDLEVSTLNEVPAGRAEVRTHIVPADNPTWMNRIWDRAREEIDQGRRVYVVCSRISASDEDSDITDESDNPQLFELSQDSRQPRELVSVEALTQQLRESAALHGISIGVLHGKLTPAEKDEAMAQFSAGNIQLLVSTTVIEVGVDVPSASMMIIMDADRFGISQLHQLRGRIGRGNLPGVCLLVAPTMEESDAHTRLQALVNTRDGFELAATDLELRHEGDVLGASQSGHGSTLRLLRVIKDADLIAQAREEAHNIIEKDPHLEKHVVLRDAIDDHLDQEAQEFLERA
ncbi:ATP-dependent DNA helicase RecG [Timonella sp. A28]|uniref:ATP-dependent DNA helicase RecG n=1 Tax=Timonella sp. A28 TaxID=3442640 RepID=UPI003EC085ED